MIANLRIANSEKTIILKGQRARHARREGSDSFAAGGGDASPGNGGKV